MNIARKGIWVLLAVLATGCGSSDDADPNLQTGRVNATAIENLRYKTQTQEGKTGADGSFNFLPGETVTFFVGHIPLGATAAKSEVTLLDLAGTTDTGDQEVVNLSRFLQSLDDPADGVVSISHNMDLLGCAVDIQSFNFDQPTAVFASNTVVSGFLRSVAQSSEMVSPSLARQNLENALSGQPLVSTAPATSQNLASANDPATTTAVNTQRSALLGDYHLLALATYLSDLDVPNTTGGDARLGFEIQEGGELTLSLSPQTDRTQMQLTDNAFDVELLMTDGVPTVVSNFSTNGVELPAPINEFLTTDQTLGLHIARTVDFDGFLYDDLTQAFNLTLEEQHSAEIYAFGDNLFVNNRQFFQGYRVAPTDSTCLEALSLSPSQFRTEDEILTAIDAKMVNNTSRITTLEQLRTNCSGLLTIDEVSEDFAILIEKHDNFVLSDLAGRYAMAFMNLSASQSLGEGLIDFYNGIESLEINDVGEVAFFDDYIEMFASAANGSVPVVYVANDSGGDVAPFTVTIDPDTGLPATDGRVDYNFIVDVNNAASVITIPSLLARNKSLLLSHLKIDNGSGNGSASLGIGLRIDGNNIPTAAQLVGLSFEFWGQRLRQNFDSAGLTSVDVSNLEGLSLTFEQVGSDVVAQVSNVGTITRLAGLAALTTQARPQGAVSSTPVTVSATGQIVFQVQDAGESVFFRGYLGADGSALFVIQGVTGTGSVPVGNPPRTIFNDVTATTAGIAIGLPISKVVETEFIAGDFEFNVLGQTFRSTIENSDCPGVLGGWQYSFTDATITLRGSDTWLSSCELGAPETLNVDVAGLTPDFDLPFACADYPVCRLSDFDKLISGRDIDGRLFTSTYVFDFDANSVIYTKNLENGNFVEVISFGDPGSRPPGFL